MAYSKIDPMIARATAPAAQAQREHRADLEMAVAMVDEEIENVRLQLDALKARIDALERREGGQPSASDT